MAILKVRISRRFRKDISQTYPTKSAGQRDDCTFGPHYVIVLHVQVYCAIQMRDSDTGRHGAASYQLEGLHRKLETWRAADDPLRNLV